MQRWFFLEDPGNALRRATCDNIEKELFTKRALEEFSRAPPKDWLFRVRVPELKRGETVCVVGDVPELGEWNPDKSIPLEQEEDPEVWSKVINIPGAQKVQYRYCVCVIIESGLQVIVHNWETNLEARQITSNDISPSKKDEPQAYGDFDNMYHTDRGWLNKETVVQLKLFKNPVLWRPRYTNRTIYIKVTPLNLTRYNTNCPKSISEALEESLSTDNQDVLENPKFAFTEVASLTSHDNSFHPQGQFGKEFNYGDMLVFQSTVLFPSNVAFLIDLYIYSSKAQEGDPPYHAGFCYIFPSALQSSVGSAVLPVTSTKHRPLGQIELEYLVIRPLNFRCDMEISYSRYWKNTWCGLDVGHRGAGSSFKGEPKNCAEVRENTLASLKSAIDHGADFVEFDVQLSKDSVPIIYHDFHVCISLKRKKQLDENDMLEIPLKELTLEQLRLLKVMFSVFFFYFELCNFIRFLFALAYNKKDIKLI